MRPAPTHRNATASLTDVPGKRHQQVLHCTGQNRPKPDMRIRTSRSRSEKTSISAKRLARLLESRGTRGAGLTHRHRQVHGGRARVYPHGLPPGHGGWRGERTRGGQNRPKPDMASPYQRPAGRPASEGFNPLARTRATGAAKTGQNRPSASSFRIGPRPLHPASRPKPATTGHCAPHSHFAIRTSHFPKVKPPWVLRPFRPRRRGLAWVTPVGRRIPPESPVLRRACPP
jgi:hypothetical protein